MAQRIILELNRCYRNAVFYSSFSALENEKDVSFRPSDKDDSGNYINLIDFSKCPNNNYYYGLSDDNRVHY